MSWRSIQVASIMEVSQADRAVGNRHSHQKAPGAKSPSHGDSVVEGGGTGRNQAKGSIRAITAAGERCWEQVTNHSGKSGQKFQLRHKIDGIQWQNGWRWPRRRSNRRCLWRGLGKRYFQPLIFILITAVMLNEAGEWSQTTPPKRRRSGESPWAQVACEFPATFPRLLYVCSPLPDLYSLFCNFLISKNLILIKLVSAALVIYLLIHFTNT